MVKSNPRKTFLKESLLNFRQIGSVTPSSSHLAKRMIAPIKPKKGMCVVELGAGTGSVTRHILEILPYDATLFVFEANKEMHNHLKKTFVDRRIRLICDDACQVGKYLKFENIEKADYIISGLPISNMKMKIRRSILSAVRDNLKPEGVFTQFQYLMTSIIGIRKLFYIENVTFEFRNIPPAFVYWCRVRK